MNTEHKYTPQHNHQLEYVACYGCRSTNYVDYLLAEEDLTGKEGVFRYVRCTNCNLVYQNPRVGLSDIKYYYDSEYIAHRKKKNWGGLTPLYEWAMNKHDRDKDKLISKYINIESNSSVLDVGCAVGTFLLHLNNKYKCHISGVDFKDGLDFPGFDKIDFHLGLFYEQTFDRKFDMITMWHFLEHCYDPNKSLLKAKDQLKDDGLLVIEVPRLDSTTFKLFKNKWPGVQAPQHTVLYDKSHLLRFVESNGLEIVDYLPYGAFPPYFYIFTGTYFKLFGKGLNLDKIILPYFSGQLLLTPILLLQKYLNLSMQTVVCKRK
ncbi:MAG: class I SAM-dependent methyltransferase [Candidatus Kapaibacteriales bacterium]